MSPFPCRTLSYHSSLLLYCIHPESRIACGGLTSRRQHVGGAAHGTLPWTLEGQTRTTLFYKFNTNGSSWTRNYLEPADFGAPRSPTPSLSPTARQQQAGRR